MTISTSYRLQVNPSGTVAPGTRLTVSSVGGASWTVSFVVAPTVTPGSDDVTAACRHSRGFSVTYQPEPITVS